MIKFQVKGNVTRPVELLYSKAGLAYARIGIASNEYDTDGEKADTSYITVTVFGQRAEACAANLGKGDLIAVEGRMQTSTREVEGKKIQNTDLLGDSVELIAKKVEKAAEPVVAEAPKAKRPRKQKAA